MIERALNHQGTVKLLLTKTPTHLTMVRFFFIATGWGNPHGDPLI